MAKQISDSERITIAALNRRETELQAAKKRIRELEAKLSALEVYIGELKDSNQIISNQLRHFIHQFSK